MDTFFPLLFTYATYFAITQYQERDWCLSVRMEQKRSWDKFTRIMSTINSVICITISVGSLIKHNDNIYDLDWKGTDATTLALSFFSSYLFYNSFIL